MIPRRKTLARSAPPARSTPVKRINRARKRRESTRANGSEARSDWMHSQPCMICGWIGNTEVAHAKTDGMGRKANAHLTLPMCGPHFVVYSRRHCALVEGCHGEQHRIGTKAFEERHQTSLIALAATVEDAWRAHCAREQA